MSYQVLARKWRPQDFQSMVGQEHVLKALVHALESQRLHHAYLFTGTRGVGKTTLGRILAKCFNCETGITAKPCGVCQTCTGITEGRYVDLIEIDAASRTKVEDMRELLDNVQYAPTTGRFKIYLIDEVHMLSTSSFNALLKTLEEPPEHVKFIFATTDPQKLPVTILSRCLQFNLKNLTPDLMQSYLQSVLGEEGVPFEVEALWSIARAADGSMRDALSLTDQAIAYSQKDVKVAAVEAMLGMVGQDHIHQLLQALAGLDAARVIEVARSLEEYSPSYDSVMAALMSVLHRVALEQQVPGSTDNAEGDQAVIQSLAASLAPETTQLFYQISLKSRQELQQVPDMRMGFEMSLLRMLAFTSDADGQHVKGAQSNIDGDQSVLDTKKKHLVEYKQEPEESRGAESEKNSADVLPLVSPDVSPAVNLISSPNEVESGLVETETLSASGVETRDIGLSGDASSGKPDTAVSADINEEIEPSASAESKVPSEPVDHIELKAQLDQQEAGSISAASINGSNHEQDSTVANRSIDAVVSDWPRHVPKMGLTGMTQNLLFNMAPEWRQSNLLLHVETGHFRLLTDKHQKLIIDAVRQYLPECSQVQFAESIPEGMESTAMWREKKTVELAEEAWDNIQNDPNVGSLVKQFDGTLVESSVKPLKAPY